MANNAIQIKALKEFQMSMARGETCYEPEDIKPILADALRLIYDQALWFLRALTRRSRVLPEGWEHIEDALTVQEGKSARLATAFMKVFRRAAPQAYWIEFGHRMVGHQPRLRDTGRYVTANPFFRPAIDMKKTEARRLIRKRLQALIAAEKGFGWGKPGDADA